MARLHDLVVADGPAGIDDVSRTLLILADRALFPITPSILDLRSVQQATGILRFAQGINGGRPDGRLVLNKFRLRDNISRELNAAAHGLGVQVATAVVRDLQAYRDAAQPGTVVGRMGKRFTHAARELDTLFEELIGDLVQTLARQRTDKPKPNKEVQNAERRSLVGALAGGSLSPELSSDRR